MCHLSVSTAFSLGYLLYFLVSLQVILKFIAGDCRRYIVGSLNTVSFLKRYGVLFWHVDKLWESLETVHIF